MATKLPEELVEEILLRIPLDDAAHLVHATAICKAWHRILSDDTFHRRYHRFHRTPTLQGFFYNDFTDTESTIRFVPTTSMAASTFCMPKVCSSSKWTPTVLNCRHGRVLLHQADEGSRGRLIVWDPIAGSQQHLRLPAYPEYPYPYNYYVAAVLCAKNDCDHLDCHGGPFLVVFVVSSYSDHRESWKTWACMYSSETGAWSASMTPYVTIKTSKNILMTPSPLVGDALHFNTIHRAYSIVKYDLYKHQLSVIHLPGDFEAILIKGTDGGLGLATMLHNCINTWSWRIDNNGDDGASMKYRVIKLDDMLFPEGDDSIDLICMAEGTNTVFIRVEGRGLFTLNLKSRQVGEIGETETDYSDIYPFVSFYTPKY